MATVHTTARGTEPYDKVYCLGYQVHHEDWSPYPRINRLRQTFLDRGYDVDVERLRPQGKDWNDDLRAKRGGHG